MRALYLTHPQVRMDAAVPVPLLTASFVGSVRETASLIRSKTLPDDEAVLFASGAMLLEADNTPLKPAVLDVLSPTQARLTITEGRYHQVRRMFAAVGNHVEALHRESLGGLALPPDLAPLLAAPQNMATLAGFISHGEFDDKLPLAWAEKAERWLNELGVPHQLQRYPAGHQLTAAMVQDFCRWLAARWLH